MNVKVLPDLAGLVTRRGRLLTAPPAEVVNKTASHPAHRPPF